jgi:hypothetical protein
LHCLESANVMWRAKLSARPSSIKGRLASILVTI